MYDVFQVAVDTYTHNFIFKFELHEKLDSSVKQIQMQFDPSETISPPTEDEWTEFEEIEQDTHSAEDLRLMANHAFSQKDFDHALPLYSMAIDQLMTEVRGKLNKGFADTADDVDRMIIYLCNRAACCFRMDMFDDAKTDAAEAFRLSDRKNAKAAFRLAKCFLALKDYSSAIETLQVTIPHTVNETEKEELEKLLQTAHAHKLASKNIKNAISLSKITSILDQSYRDRGEVPSVREFEILRELGEGNYSQVVAVKHTVTGENFALKMIDKKKVDTLGKRQHPNVYNEIEMERRVLGERLKSQKDGEQWCRRIVALHFTFADYQNLYYLMDLHIDFPDMWSTLRYKDKMVGTHHSLVKAYLFELLEALEFIHRKGIVHRDLKAENLLLNSKGHLILIDFGTSKDLIQTDLNGPEFVGTAEFMSPEAIKGPKNEKNVEGMTKEDCSDHTLDLWAFGCVAFQLMTGSTPFASPSPYLAYLKIPRGLLCRPMGISDDTAWDLITSLMKVEPNERLGAKCFQYVRGENNDENQMIEMGEGYDVIRRHPYFKGCDSAKTELQETVLIPSLKDLCIRPCTELVINDANNIELELDSPPGNKSSHDMLRLNREDRGRVMDMLDRLRLLAHPRIYRRFFVTKQEARLSKVREATRDFVGLTQMNDKQYQFPMKDSENTDPERSDVLETIFPIRYIHVTNPLFCKSVNENCKKEERDIFISQLKESLRTVNKTRPKIVVASGHIDEQCRKIMGKVNESIPVALNDQASFFSFWSCGGQGLMIRSKDILEVHYKTARESEQMLWLKQELEQSRMTRHHQFAFVDCDPNMLPDWFLRFLLKGRVLCLFGITSGENYEHEFVLSQSFDKDSTPSSDDVSVTSSDSDTIENEHFCMRIVGRGDSSLKCINLEEYGAWNFENI